MQLFWGPWDIRFSWETELFITYGINLFFTIKSVTNNTKILAVAHFDTSNLLVNAMMSGTRI